MQATLFQPASSKTPPCISAKRETRSNKNTLCLFHLITVRNVTAQWNWDSCLIVEMTFNDMYPNGDAADRRNHGSLLPFCPRGTLFPSGRSVARPVVISSNTQWRNSLQSRDTGTLDEEDMDNVTRDRRDSCGPKVEVGSFPYGRATDRYGDDAPIAYPNTFAVEV